MANEIKVVLSLTDKDMTVNMVRAGEAVKTFNTQLGQVKTAVAEAEGGFDALGEKFRETVFTLSILRFALRDVNDILLSIPKAVIESSASFEKMTKLMEGLSKETDETKRQMEALANRDYIINLSLNAPFSLKSLQESFVLLKSGGIDPTNGSLQALTDSVAKFGGSGEILEHAALAIQQMAGKGVVAMQELRQQLGEAVPDAMQDMALGIGVSMAQMNKLVASGQLEAISATDRMFTVMSVLNRGKAQEMMETWNGTIEQMKTKVALFYNDIGTMGDGPGQSGGSFMSVMKKDAQDLNDLLGDQGMKKLAFDLGQGFIAIAGAVKSLVMFVHDWGTELKVAGEVFFTFFAVNRMRDVIQGFQSILTTARALVDAGDASKLGKGNIFQTYAEGSEMALQRARAFDTEMTVQAGRRIAEMHVDIAENADKVAAIEAQEAGLANRRKQLLMDVAGIQRSMNAAQNANTFGSVVLAEARDKELNFLRQSLESRRAAIVTLGEEAIAYRAELAAINESSNAIRANILEEERAAVSARTAGSAMTSMGASISGLKNVFNALGGWVTVAVSAFALAIEKLYELTHQAEHLKELVDSVKDGAATQATADDLKSKGQAAIGYGNQLANQIFEIRRKIAQENAALEESGKTHNTAQAQAATMMLEGLRDQLNQRLAEQKKNDELIKTYTTSAATAQAQVYEASAAREVRGFIDVTERSARQKNAALMEENQALTEQRQKAIEDARKANPNLTVAQAEAIDKPIRDQLYANMRAQTNATIGVYKDALGELKRQIAGTTSEAAKAQLGAEADAALKKIGELQQTLLGEDKLGTKTLLNGNAKEKIIHEDPITKYAADARDSLEKAKVQFAQINSETNQLLTGKETAVIQTLQELADGRFDSKDSKGNVSQPAFNARGTYVGQFIEYLKSGKTDVDNFIQSLRGLNPAAAATLAQAAKDIASKNEQLEVNKALESSLGRVTSAQAFMGAAIEATNDKTNVASKELEAIIAHYDDLARKIGQATMESSGLNKARQSELSSRVVGDEYTAGLKDIQAAQKTFDDATLSAAQKAAQEHARRMTEIQEEHDARVKLIQQYVTDQTTANNTLAEENQRYLAQKTAEEAKSFKESETALDKLVRGWKDSDDALNQANAQVATDWMNQIENLAITGKGSIKSMVESMIQDFERLAIQNTIGSAIGTAAKGAGNEFASLMQRIGVSGFGTPAANGSDASKSMGALVPVVDATKTGLQKLTSDGIAKTVTSMTQQVTTQTLQETAMTTATANLAAFSAALVAATAAATSSSGGSIAKLALAAANGGVMTNAGPMALKKYATGGVATEPQLALFGEGSMNEAYVPLPDGKSIPVSMKQSASAASQGQGGSGGRPPGVTVNVLNQSGNDVGASQGGTHWDGKQMVLDVILDGMSQAGPFRSNMQGLMRQ